MHNLKALLDKRIDEIIEDDFNPDINAKKLITTQIENEYLARCNNVNDPTEFSDAELESLIESAHEALDTEACTELHNHIKDRLKQVRDHANTMAEHRHLRD